MLPGYTSCKNNGRTLNDKSFHRHINETFIYKTLQMKFSTVLKLNCAIFNLSNALHIHNAASIFDFLSELIEFVKR
jgi:hypothetical protein